MEKLYITEIMHRGELEEELVVMQVLMDCNLSDFMLVDADVSEDDAALNTVHNVFWFPDKYVKADDFVLVYTAGGDPTIGNNQTGSKTHVHYWGKKHPVWSEGKRYAILVSIQEVSLKSLE